MKKIKYWIILLACVAVSCKEKTGNGEPPAKIEQYEVTEINGGAIITYAIPSSDALLCVTAEYVRNGQPYKESASAYKNSIRVEGFKTTDPVTVLLYSEDRYGNRSEAIEVEFTPLKSPIALAQESLKWSATYGGVIVEWENPEKTELGISLMATDSTGALVRQGNIVFSHQALGSNAFMNLEAKETAFAILIEDKWGNSSDMIYFVTAPLFQTLIAKPYGDMRMTIPWDNTSDLISITGAWDNIISEGIGDEYISNNGSYGCSFTIDLKQVAKLSRLIWHPFYNAFYSNYGIYDQVNIMSFEMWGTKAIDQSTLSNRAYWLDDVTMNTEGYAAPGVTIPSHPARTFKDDWAYLGLFEVERLDLKGASIDEMLAAAIAGHVFPISLDVPPVRYIRIFPRITAWGGLTGPPPRGNYWRVNEITFYGDNRVPQE
jgi:hypothetical protein